MDKKTVEKLLKMMIAALGLTGIICCILMPNIIMYIFPGWSAPTLRLWLGILYCAALPCFAALIPSWRIAGSIGKGKSFSEENVKSTRIIGILTAAETAFLFAANILTFAIGRSFPAFFAAFYLVIALFFAVCTVSFSISALLKNAVVLQDQSDYTI